MLPNEDIPTRGEGNHEADAEYRERTQRFVDEEDVEGHAEDAAEAMDDDDEGAELEEARQRTKNAGK